MAAEVDRSDPLKSGQERDYSQFLMDFILPVKSLPHAKLKALKVCVYVLFACHVLNMDVASFPYTYVMHCCFPCYTCNTAQLPGSTCCILHNIMVCDKSSCVGQPLFRCTGSDV